MKYLKPFNESVDNDEIIQNIEDILTELKDDGHPIHINNDETIIDVLINNVPNNISPVRNWYPLIKSNILSLINYMDNENYEYFVYSNFNGFLRTLEQYESKLPTLSGNLLSFRIKFVLKDEVY